MEAHTLVLPVLLLTVHFLSRSALQQQLQVMHTNRKTVHGEILPETWNPRFPNLSLQSPAAQLQQGWSHLTSSGCGAG